MTGDLGNLQIKISHDFYVNSIDSSFLSRSKIKWSTILNLMHAENIASKYGKQ